jgi:hypothetical protein
MRKCFNRMLVTLVLTGAATALLAPLPGCTPWATYPRVKGMTELGSPATEPVPTLMARAVGYIKENKCEGAQYAVNLPPGVPAKVYDKVFADIGYSRPMTSEGDLAYHVTEVRLRGLNAEVDVIYPFDGEHELTTIKFRNSVMPGWNVVDARTWNIYFTVPGPNYIPAEQAIATETGSAQPSH